MKNKWSGGKIAGVIIGCIAMAIVLVIAFIISIYQLAERIEVLDYILEEYDSGDTKDSLIDKDLFDGIGDSFDGLDDYDFNDSYDDNSDDSDDSDDYNDDNEDYNKEDSKGSNYLSGEYYDFADAIDENLSYSIEFSTIEDSYTSKGEVNARLVYPQISGKDIKNIDGINATLRSEMEEMSEYVESMSGMLSASDRYEVSEECYITYMDEQTLSVAFMDSEYINDEYFLAKVTSLNIDMETGLPMSNTELLNIDDDFSIDFRNRSDEQNGGIDFLSYYSDQEITDFMNDEDSLIIFYTPLGMEVGFNYDDGWVTVTYKDYKKFQKKM